MTPRDFSKPSTASWPVGQGAFLPEQMPTRPGGGKTPRPTVAATGALSPNIDLTLIEDDARR